MMGVMIENGIVKEGTPICVPSKEVNSRIYSGFISFVRLFDQFINFASYLNDTLAILHHFAENICINLNTVLTIMRSSGSM